MAKKSAATESTPAEAVKALGEEPTITITIAGQTLVGDARRFSTGSLGYGVYGKVTLKSGKKLQISMNAPIVGTKPTTAKE